MPTYEYKCTDCEHVIELLVPMKDRNNVFECTKCSGKAHRIEIVGRVGKLHIWTRKKVN